MTEREVLYIIETAKALKRESNLLELDAPITVCRDVHRQYYDLVQPFEIGSDPADTELVYAGSSSSYNSSDTAQGTYHPPLSSSQPPFLLFPFIY
jgi:hypothetical protein